VDPPVRPDHAIQKLGRNLNHEPCGEDGEWLNGPTVDILKRPNDQSFHPNECGQAAMAVLVNLRLNAYLAEVECG